MHDVVIVGAGPVGATLALGLRDADLDVVALDVRALGAAARSDRSLALSHGARLILERLGVWPSLVAVRGAVTPITRIDISQRGGFGTTELVAHELDLPALGYVVSYRALQSALDAALACCRISMRFGAAVERIGATASYAAVSLAAEQQPIVARLAVVADGSGAKLDAIRRERKDYGHVAVTAKIALDGPHEGRAFERFTPEGPMALLPEGDEYGVVWTMTPERAQRVLALADDAFLDSLADRFGRRVARFVGVHSRRSFPLKLEFSRQTIGSRAVVIGNAAQSLHPVAGQGFNLGMRDAIELAQTIVETPSAQLGDRQMLDAYASRRRVDRFAGIAFTDGLVQLFGNDWPLLRWPRGVALTLLDAFPPAKRMFARAMLFGIH